MISKFSKMRDSLFTKVVLSITALSFMSLFGVSGYITTAGSNKTVIKVDDMEFSQSEFSYLLQKEIAKLKLLQGDEIDESDEKKNELITTLAKLKLEDMMIERVMSGLNIDFTDNLVSQIIQVSPQFQSNGVFDREIYKWYLNRNGISEKELIADIKRNMARQVLLESQVYGFKVPQVLQKQMEKVLGQRRTFRYIKIANENAKIDRRPTAEELDQYYQDFSEEFVVPEKRDVSIMFLSMADIEKNINISADEISSYYKEHIDEFEKPEQRKVLQMYFETEEKAKDASKKLANGQDFTEVAMENGQALEEIDLGYVSKADLSEELGEAVFSLSKNTVSAPLHINESWQLLQVTDIKKASKTDRKVAEEKIVAELKQQQAYDGSYDLIKSIEDKIGAGISLEELAKTYNVPVIQVKSVAEDGTSSSRNKDINVLLQNQDVRDVIFSYNAGELTKAVETDEGIVVSQIDNIIEAHVLPQEEVTAELEKLWQENERASITQEMKDNIEHDLEAGDSLTTVARRYGFKVIKTMPITRGETFDNLNFNDKKQLFNGTKGESQIFKVGEDYVVVETNNIYDDSSSLSKEEKEFLTQALKLELTEEMSEALLKGFAKDYKIEVHYNRMGLND